MESMVVWDQSGVLRATKTVLNSNVSSSFAAEAYVGLHAVKLGISLGFHSVMIKGHSRKKKCTWKAMLCFAIGQARREDGEEIQIEVRIGREEEGMIASYGENEKAII
ncbi:hypothetical protein J1N35_030382 [Gossypium stocksii]|uniref:RNase H type-1 domain-containing protein n=1 Tax=Gossypium stocksii TaxID=47602 RepID=A0A9D3ZUC4_9ROSI|nr:hypothetical protein J1N35_030382 [Gossypium stocksii]